MGEVRRANTEAQRDTYGAPLSEIFDRIKHTLGLNQGALAKVLGLSAPMLSQLNSAQRVKIGNPAVLGRVQRLNELAEAVQAGNLDAVDIQEQLEEIQHSTGALTQRTSTAQPTSTAQTTSTAQPTSTERTSADGTRPGGLQGSDASVPGPASPVPAHQELDAAIVVGMRNLLRAVASGSELRDAADQLSPQYPRLAEVLRLYGIGSSQPAVEHFQQHKDLF